MTRTRTILIMSALAILLPALLYSTVSGQSTDQNFPTPVRTSEISGVIKARDVGDSRLTTHYYTFEGGQGDLFINVQTTNFSGDVDVYVMSGLRPLTKMVMYADASVSETGRVVYLRKPETILLRIEGRTPGDEEASYRIKFAGSFVASRAVDNAPEIPKVNAENQSNIRVNSVGTIIEVIPRSTPSPIDTAGEETQDKVKNEESTENKESEAERAETQAVTKPSNSESKVVITDPIAERPKPTSTRANRRTQVKKKIDAEATKPADRDSAAKEDPEASKKDEIDAESAKKPSAAKRAAKLKDQKVESPEGTDPMANVRLVIRFKDGAVIERPMTEVFKFTVERAVLTVIGKDGTIGRYRMIEVSGVTIE